MSNWNKSTQSPTAWQRVKLAITAGAALVGYAYGSSYAAATVGSAVQKSAVGVANVTALRALLKTENPFARTAGYTTAGDKGHGWYYCDTTDTTSADDGGAVIVATDGGRWKLLHQGTIYARQYGAKGDGATDDATALNTWVAYCTANHIIAHFGDGNFHIGASLIIPKRTRLQGNGHGDGAAAWGTRLITTANTFAALLGKSADMADYRSVHISGIHVIGGTKCIHIPVTGTMSGCEFSDLWLTGSANDTFLVDMMMISCEVRDVIFDATPSGYSAFKVAAANCNNVMLINPWFTECDGKSISIVGGGENFHVINPRFEARHTAAITGGTVVSLQNVKAWHIDGGYCEETFVNFLTETSSTDTGRITGMRFSGAESDVGGAGLKANTFTSDGVVDFAGCQFNIPSNATSQCMVSAPCSGLLTANSHVWLHKSKSHVQVSTKQISVTASGTAEDLFTFSRANTNNADNQQVFSGEIVVQVAGKTSGGTPSGMTLRRRINVMGFANATITVTFGATEAADDNAPGAALTLALKAGATSTDATVVATYTLASMGVSVMSAHLIADSLTNPSYAAMTVLPVAS